MIGHWTNRDINTFAYAVASNFVAQLETKLDEKGIDNKDLAKLTGTSRAYISQVLNNPGNMGVVTMAKLTRALGMKVVIVAYEDNDPDNDDGPVGSEVFRQSWKYAGCPRDLSAFPSNAHSDLQSVNWLDNEISFNVLGSQKKKPPQPVYEEADTENSNMAASL